MRWGPALFCESKLDPKKVMGTGGVAVTFVKLWMPGPACSGLQQTQWVQSYMWQRLPLKQRELETVWILLNPFVFHPFSPPGLFLLCVIHIHSITTLLHSVLSIPQCISLRLHGRCFRSAEPILGKKKKKKVRQTWALNIKLGNNP